MRSALFTVTFLLFLGTPSGATDDPGEAVVCAPESYVPYVAVARWSDTEPVRLSVLPLTQPLGAPRTVTVPGEPSGPVRIRCEAGSLDLWTSKGSLRIENPAGRSMSVAPAPKGLAPPADEDFARFACRNGRLLADPLRTPRGKHRRLPVDLGRRYEPFRFGLRSAPAGAEDGVRWSLVVQGDRRRGTPNGRLSRSHVSRAVTVLELVCPRSTDRPRS